MFECPNCGDRALLPATKVFASALFPAICPNCGKHIGIKGMFSGTYSAVVEFVVIAFVLLAGGVKPTATGVLLLLLFCGINLPLGAVRPLAPIAAGEISSARLIAGVGSALVAILGAWAVFHE